MIFLNVCDQESLRKEGSPPNPPPLEELLREDEEIVEYPLTPRSPPPPLSASFLPTRMVRYRIPERKPGYPWMELYGALVAALSFLCSGVVQSYTSGAIYSMQTDVAANFSLTHSHISWIASAPPLASLVGTLVSGPVMENLGRKQALTILAVPFILGWLVIGVALNFGMILVGRLLTGVALGMARAVAPVYVSETARAKHRGKLGYLPPILCASGILLGCTLGSWMHWKSVAFLMISFPSILLLGTIYLPESPHWLIRQKQEDLAFQSLKRLRYQRGTTQDDQFIFKEIREIREAVDEHKLEHENDPHGQVVEEKRDTTLWKLLHQPHVRYPAMLIFLLMVFQQFSGVSAVVYYLKMILNHGATSSRQARSSTSGGSADDDDTQPPDDHDQDMRPMIVALVHFFAFFLTIPLVDRVGRKLLLLISGVLMTLSQLVLSYYMYVYCGPASLPSSTPVTSLSDPSPLTTNITMTLRSVDPADENTPFLEMVHQWVPLVALCSYIASFSLASPIPFILMTEIFASNVRSYLCCGATLVSSIAAFIVVKTFPLVMYGVSPAYAFLMFAIFSLQTSTIACLMPETKGKSLAEIENLFRGPPQYSKGRVKAVIEVPSCATDVSVAISPQLQSGRIHPANYGATAVSPSNTLFNRATKM